MSHPTRYFFILVGISLLTGCGPEAPYRVRKSSYAVKSALQESTSDEEGAFSEYTCVENPNVKPDYDWHLDGTGFYTACPARSSNTQIKLHGNTRQSDTVCVFPAQFISRSQIFSKPGPDALPMYKCVAGSEDGIYLDFPDTNYNSVYVVEQGAEQAMQLCLSTGNYFECPREFSFGKFR